MTAWKLMTSSFVLSLSLAISGAACTTNVDDAASDAEDPCDPTDPSALVSIEPLASTPGDADERRSSEYQRCRNRCEDRYRNCRGGRWNRDRDRMCRRHYESCNDECRRRSGGGHGHEHEHEHDHH